MGGWPKNPKVRGEEGQGVYQEEGRGRRGLMNTNVWVFRLQVIGQIGHDNEERLYESGANDGIVESHERGWSIGFDRENETFEEAVVSAIEDVEAASLEVIEIEDDELLSASDIASRTGRTRQSISHLIAGVRGTGSWPRPVAGNVRSPLWRWVDVAEWFREYDGSTYSFDEHAAAVRAAVNDVLRARRTLRQRGSAVELVIERLNNLIPS